jgi:type II secretory pathway pseudopilin PulG
MAFRQQTSNRGQRGYILLFLLLTVALLSIGFLALVRNLEFQSKRDREEELIHRGVQYSRAVRRYFKKFGRYPTKIEDLEDTNNIRFLRKRYKDPMNRDRKTGKELDFKVLHLQDVQTSFSSGSIKGAVAASDLASAEPAQSSAEVQAGAPGALDGSAAAPGGPGPSAIAGQQNQADQAQTGQNGPTATPPAPQPLAQRLGPNGAPQVFGGGAIAGVASLNKEKTIRVFNKKDHYNQWQFIYDPTTDRGGLLMTPNQPPLMNAAQNVNQQQNGQQGSFGINGQNQGTFAQPMNNPNTNNQNMNAPPQPNMPPDQNQ